MVPRGIEPSCGQQTRTNRFEWDFERIEPVEDVPNGSALLLAHHSDVTFGNIHVTPITKPGN